MRRQTVFSLLQVVVSLAIGAGLTLFFFSSTTTNQRDRSAEESEPCVKEFPLTDRRLSCAEYAESRDKMQTLENELANVVQSYVTEKKAARISVWIRDLTTRQWAAYNEHEQYIPASLLKVPLMIAYYRLAELKPDIMKSSMVYQPQKQTNGQNIKPSSTLTPGTSYTVESLLDRMVRYSDNDVMRLLVDSIDAELLNQTLTDLGLQMVTDSQTVNFVTVKTYANMFRILYNASYLDRKSSEKVLSVLATTEFKGIAEPLPLWVKVAHKFGEREVEDETGHTTTVQLHDCGIVYKEKRPYSLCIMTEGNNLELQQKINREISKFVYDTM